MRIRHEAIPKDAFVSTLLRYIGDNSTFALADVKLDIENTLRQLARILEDGQWIKAKLAFDSVDTQKKGSIDISQWRTILKQLGYYEGEHNLKDQFTEMRGSHQLVSFVLYMNFMNKQKEERRVLKERQHALAKEIYDQYISDTAPAQVNIISLTRDEIKTALLSGNINAHTFDKAEKEILELMGADPFARFKQSALFQKFLDDSQSYRVLDDQKKQVARNATRQLRSGSAWDRNDAKATDESTGPQAILLTTLQLPSSRSELASPRSELASPRSELPSPRSELASPRSYVEPSTPKSTSTALLLPN